MFTYYTNGEAALINGINNLSYFFKKEVASPTLEIKEIIVFISEI